MTEKQYTINANLTQILRKFSKESAIRFIQPLLKGSIRESNEFRCGKCVDFPNYATNDVLKLELDEDDRVIAVWDVVYNFVNQEQAEMAI